MTQPTVITQPAYATYGQPIGTGQRLGYSTVAGVPIAASRLNEYGHLYGRYPTLEPVVHPIAA